jgi:hypothetical protein
MAGKNVRGDERGVDVEPLRAGMAELDDPAVGREPESVRSLPPVRRRAETPAVSAPGAASRLDEDVAHHLADEVEDFELGGACARPPA